MIVKLLTEHHLEFLNLNEGCRGSSESTLAKMSNCWISHVTAQLCVKNEIEFIDNYDCFILASGKMPSSFFHHDKLHLNVHGTRRLLSGINKVIPVSKYTFRPYKLKIQQGRHTSHKKRTPLVANILSYMFKIRPLYTRVLVQRKKHPVM